MPKDPEVVVSVILHNAHDVQESTVSLAELDQWEHLDHLQGFLDLINTQAPTVVRVEGLESLLVCSFLFESVQVDCCSNKFLIINGSCRTKRS